MSVAALREGVFVEEADGVVLVHDPDTGLGFNFGSIAAGLLGRPISAEDARQLDGLLAKTGLAASSAFADVEKRRVLQQQFFRQSERDARPRKIETARRRAVDNVAWYARSPYTDSSVPFEALPLVTKENLRVHFDDMLVRGLALREGLEKGELQFAATSGTTGERLQVVSDMTIKSVPDEYETMWGLPALGDEPHRTAIFTGPACLGNECRLGAQPYEERIKGETTLYLNSPPDLFTMKPDLVDQVLAELSRFKPHMLFVNPVYLHWFGLEATRLGKQLPPVDAVLSAYQYLNETQKRGIEKLFGTNVFNYYFATDLAGSRFAVECENRRLHIREDHVVAEIVDRYGASRAPGEIGALVITSYSNRIMPVLRYRVGDLARITDVVCGCSIDHWQTLELHGRQKDMVESPSGWLTTKQVDDALAKIEHLAFYAVRQSRIGLVDLDVIANPGATVSEAACKDALASIALNLARFRVVRRLEPEPSMKFRATACSHTEAPLAP